MSSSSRRTASSPSKAGRSRGPSSTSTRRSKPRATRPGIKVAEEIITGESYGFAVNPANTALLAAINAAFADMLADGFYQTTYDLWIERPGASVLFGG